MASRERINDWSRFKSCSIVFEPCVILTLTISSDASQGAQQDRRRCWHLHSMEAQEALKTMGEQKSDWTIQSRQVFPFTATRQTEPGQIISRPFHATSIPS